jgi:tetratricopeptide (TPR) repeat protein
MENIMKKLLLLFVFAMATEILSDSIVDSYTQEAKRDYAKALDTMEGLSKENPNDYFIQLRTGWIALVKGDYTKSASYYQKATLLAPNAIEPRLGNVRALLAQGQYKQVDVACKTILKLDSKNYFARSTLAYTNYVLQNYLDAKGYYESIVADYPADTEMQIGLGWSYLKLGEKGKAKSVFALLKKVIPNEERVTSGASYADK